MSDGESITILDDATIDRLEHAAIAIVVVIAVFAVLRAIGRHRRQLGEEVESICLPEATLHAGDVDHHRSTRRRLPRRPWRARGG